MALYQMSVGSGVEVSINYNANNGAASGMVVSNTGTMNAYAEVTLTDGRVFGQVFLPGSVTVNLPSGAVKVVGPDASGEMSLSGVRGWTLRVPA